MSNLLQALGAHLSDKLYLFSSHAEAIEWLFVSFYLEQIRPSGKHHLLTPEGEEEVICASLKRLEGLGCHTHVFSKEAINPRVSLLSLSWASSLTGVVRPVEEWVKICKEKHVAVHVDVSHALGKWPIAFEESGVDFMTFDGRFLPEPQEVAGLLIRASSSLPEPLSATLGMQPDRAGLTRAVLHAQKQQDPFQLETARLRALLEKGVVQGFPSAQVLFKHSPRLPHCSALTFPGVHAEALLFLLQRKQIYASKIDATSLCFHLSSDTEIASMVDQIVTAAHHLRRLSSQVVCV